MKQNSINSDNAYLTTVYWNGNTTDKVHFGSYYKVTMHIPCNLDDLIGGTVTDSNNNKYTVTSMEIINNGAYYTIDDGQSTAAIAIFTKHGNGVDRGVYFYKNLLNDLFIQQLTYYRSCFRF